MRSANLPASQSWELNLLEDKKEDKKKERG